VIGRMVARFAAGLRFPTLFKLVAALFVVDMVLPDVIPFMDEILLGLGTLLLGSLRRRREAPAAPGDPVHAQRGGDAGGIVQARGDEAAGGRA